MRPVDVFPGCQDVVALAAGHQSLRWRCRRDAHRAREDNYYGQLNYTGRPDQPWSPWSASQARSLALVGDGPPVLTPARCAHW